MATEAPKNARHVRLAARLADLQKWVELELELPEDQQVSLGRVDSAARSFLGEFAQRAARRARAAVDFQLMQHQAKAATA